MSYCVLERTLWLPNDTGWPGDEAEMELPSNAWYGAPTTALDLVHSGSIDLHPLLRMWVAIYVAVPV